jgi:hypothetical protein
MFTLLLSIVQMYIDNAVSIKHSTEATSLPLLGITVHGYRYLMYLRYRFNVKRNVLLLIILAG